MTEAINNKTTRFITLDDIKLPANATWKTVLVKFENNLNPIEYKQPFISDNKRLCRNCLKEIKDFNQSPTVILLSTSYLFCTGKCEVEYCIKSSSSHIRRELFKYLITFKFK